ncbi:MAG: hypothetical protein MZU79_07380 [Anaerotruncus sp.]|nr:hypothetical protein [Anaerotruncus sp.]
MTRENVLAKGAVPEERLGPGAEAGPEGGLRQAQGARAPGTSRSSRRPSRASSNGGVAVGSHRS